MVRIGITLGDPRGIGPEIILKALVELDEVKNLTIIGSASILSATKDMLALNIPLPKIVDTGEVTLSVGQVSRQAGKTAFDALVKACELIKDGEIDALVTAPVNKRAVQLSEPSFIGHTEFLAQAFGVDEVLMVAHSAYASFAFVTTHLPIGEVPRYITADRVFAKLILYNDFLKTLHGRDPRIAVLAANPHGHEFSQGEEEQITEAVQRAQNKGVDVQGPYPADTFHYYMNAVDGFLVQYHDQGMIPAKMLSSGEGVNVTWGLPFVRTSPLHGTAFDIAGKGQADPKSMIAAIRMAAELRRD